MIGSWPLQKALLALLTTGSPTPLPATAGRVYDDVPQGATFPFVEIGDSLAVPDDVSSSTVAAGDKGVSEFLDLHVWSRYRGKREVKEIFGNLHALLHGVALSVEGRSSALSWVRNSRILLDPDGITRHGVLTIEVIHRN